MHDYVVDLLKGARVLRIEVLGPLRVVSSEEIALERASHRRVLAILALAANRLVGTDALIERNWGGEPPATAKAVIQTHVSALRKLLPDGVIATEGYGYRLDLDGQEFDADELASLASEAHAQAVAREWQAVLDATGPALALWRGRPYEDLTDDEFARPEIDRLEELRLELLQLRCEALLGLDRAAEAVLDLGRLVEEHPLREFSWELLMTARYRLGRHAEALEAYREAWSVFADVGLEPSPALRRLEQKILRHEEAVSAGARHNLPVELASFVGRERELVDVAALLDEHRLVTLTGVGGSGKTRIALRVASRALDDFPDGCWFAELATVSEHERVPFQVAEAVGIRPRSGNATTSLTAAIAGDTALIVLDNCEHVGAAAAALAQAVLESAPGVRVLATSREPLRVPGEAVFDVPPMSYPSAGDGDGLGLLAFDAVRLFTERAALYGSSFALDVTNAGVISRICRRLDGIPLAIELAAARAGSLSPDSIADRLDDRFHILSEGPLTGPERHRTLEAALAWSYDLLDGAQQLLFARLSVFRGGFTLEMAEHVCSGDGIDGADVALGVAALVEKSLVSTWPQAARQRFRLLQTVRQYAAGRLVGGDREALQGRHADWCLGLALDVVERVHGAGRWEVFERLDLESDNLEAALEWAGRRAVHHVELLARALAWHSLDQGQLGLCASYARTAIRTAADVESEAAARSVLGTALFLAGDGNEAFEESSRACRLVVDRDGSPHSVPVLTACARLHLLLLDHDPLDAISLSRQALAVAEASDDPFAMIYARRALGRALVWNGDGDAGLQLYQSALDLALETGDRAMTLETYESYFVLLYLHPTARRSEPSRVAREMLDRFPLDGDRWGRYTPADWLPTVFLQEGAWDEAEQAIERLGSRHLEGWDKNAHLVHLGSLRWMQGALDDARSALTELESAGVNAGWYHVYYPLLAEIAADQGRLDDVRAAVDEYLALDVHAAHESLKLAALSPLARAEVDAALRSIDGEKAEHVEHARAAFAMGRDILDSFPPLSEGSLQMETAMTYHALAEAELTRLPGAEPHPASWADIVEHADFLYFQLYARWRLAQALARLDRTDAVAHEIGVAGTQAAGAGAKLLRRRLETVARDAGMLRPFHRQLG